MAQIIQSEQGNYVLCDPGTGQICSEQDILDVMGFFREAGAYLLLIGEGALHPDFFDLSTGLAGEISLKLTTYRVRKAIVIDLGSVPSQQFREWAGECNRGGEIRFYAGQDEAENWLVDCEV